MMVAEAQDELRRHESAPAPQGRFIKAQGETLGQETTTNIKPCKGDLSGAATGRPYRARHSINSLTQGFDRAAPAGLRLGAGSLFCNLSLKIVIIRFPVPYRYDRPSPS